MNSRLVISIFVWGLFPWRHNFISSFQIQSALSKNEHKLENHGLSDQENIRNLSNINLMMKRMHSTRRFNNSFEEEKVSLYRTINELKITKCKWLRHNKTLPSVSIIITFYDSDWETLMQTTRMLLLRSPRRLIKEILIIDDNADNNDMRSKMNAYVSKHFTNVRVVHKTKREGLIKARLLGAKLAKGKVLVFMDSHCTVGVKWLPPLLEPIKENYKTVTCPFIDINDTDTSLYSQDEGARGAFDWNFNYTRLPRLHNNKTDPEDPFDNPIMQGRIFAITRNWFWELGGYDEGLEIWGGEQFELSFKIWMCGGRMVNVPCSRIRCIFKDIYSFDFIHDDIKIRKNYKRIAEIWMDNWKKFIYQRHLEEYSSFDCGDISKQKKLQQKLNCKSFDWFMENVAYDILYLYPPIPVSEKLNCSITLESDDSICVDSKYRKQGDRVGIDQCNQIGRSEKNKEQRFSFTSDFEIRPGQRNLCFDYRNSSETLMLSQCDLMNPNQKWEYNSTSHQITNIPSQKCIKVNSKSLLLLVNNCSLSSTMQKWIIQGCNDNPENSTKRTK